MCFFRSGVIFVSFTCKVRFKMPAFSSTTFTDRDQNSDELFRRIQVFYIGYILQIIQSNFVYLGIHTDHLELILINVVLTVRPLVHKDLRGKLSLNIILRVRRKLVLNIILRVRRELVLNIHLCIQCNDQMFFIISFNLSRCLLKYLQAAAGIYYFKLVYYLEPETSD